MRHLLLLGADFAWAQFYPQKATLIQVDRDGSHLGRRHPVDLGVVGDVIPTPRGAPCRCSKSARNAASSTNAWSTASARCGRWKKRSKPARAS